MIYSRIMTKRREVLKRAAFVGGIGAFAGCASENQPNSTGGSSGNGSNSGSGSTKNSSGSGNSLPNSILVGVLAPLTGSNATAGTSIEKAAKLRAQQINDQGGIDGQIQVELSSADSKCSPSDGTSELQNLISQDDIDFLIGGYCSPVTIATIPITAQNNIIQITPSEAAPITGDKHERNVFREGPQSQQQAPKLLEYALDKDNNSSFALLAANNDWGTSQVEALKEAASSMDAEITSTQMFDMDTSDFSTEMTKVKNSDAEAVIAIGYEAQNINMAKSYDTLGLSKDVYGSILWGYPSVRNEVGDITTNMTLRYPNVIDSTRKITAQFRSDYREAYDEEAWANASWGYGGLQILEQAIVGAQSTSHSDVRDWLYANKVDVVQGSFGFADCGQAEVEAQIATNKQMDGGVGVEPLTDFNYASKVVPEIC